MALIVEAPYENLIDLRERAKREVSKVVIGQDRAVELLLVAALARGHVLLEGPPGSAKTLLGRAAAHMLGASFKRIQFTPDTTPARADGQVHDPRGRADLPPRRRLHERAARGRDQPHAAAHAGRPARGDAGAPGHGRGQGATGCPTRSSSSRRRTRTSTGTSSSCRSRSSTASSSRSQIEYSDPRQRVPDDRPAAQGRRAGHARRGAAAARRRRPRQGADRARLDRHPGGGRALHGRDRARHARRCRASSSA